ncbi:MAG: hypothetical protein AB1Z98_15175 [Nannocystaceae bacterium]
MMGRRVYGGIVAGALGLVLLGCGDDGDGGTDGMAGSSGSGGSVGSSGDGSPSTEGPGSTGGEATSGGSTGDEAGSSTGGEAGSEGSSGGALEPIYEEIDGIVSVEAEHAEEVDDNGTERSWYLFSAADQPTVEPDPDPPHWDSASGAGCLEGLPDTRVTHDDPLQGGVNFYPAPGDGPILRYRVWVNQPGRYWVRVRAYSTGTEDNGIHVGLDGQWPASGARVQWCSGKNQWTWSGAQRTDANHCGEANMIFLDIDEPGEHEIMFSMREDGFEMDKWMLTDDSSVFPEDAGPDESPWHE